MSAGLSGTAVPRPFAACLHCRGLKRRCEGGPACKPCAALGVQCVFAPPKKRGPQAKKPAAIVLPFDIVKVARPLSPPGIAAGPDPFLFSPGLSTLFRVVDFANVTLGIVDGAALAAALEPEPVDATPRRPGAGAPPASLHACVSMLLCAEARTRGDDAAAEWHYGVALDCVGQALAAAERPSALLSSALLLISMMARPLGRGGGDAASHAMLAAAVASSSCPASDFALSDDARLAVAVFRNKNLDVSAGGGWPPGEAPTGQPPLARLVSILSFAFPELMRGFASVPPARVPAFAALLDEAESLQEGLRAGGPSAPLAAYAYAPAMSPALCALLALRDGRADEAAPLATRALLACCPPTAAPTATDPPVPEPGGGGGGGSGPAQGFCTLLAVSRLLLAVPEVMRRSASGGGGAGSPAEGDLSCSPRISPADALGAAALRVLRLSTFAVGPIAPYFDDVRADVEWLLLPPSSSHDAAATPSPRPLPEQPAVSPSLGHYMPRLPGRRDAAVLEAIYAALVEQTPSCTRVESVPSGD